jgi:hypothetical protein
MFAKPTRTLYNADAIVWLAHQAPIEGASFVTSLPDISEFSNISVEDWKTWFTEAAQLVISRCPQDGIAIFYQSDIKRDGVWIDKGYLCQKAAQAEGAELIAHKIVCRAPPGQVRFGRAGYSHLLCFSKGIKPDIAKSTTDVLLNAGPTTWTRGMGLEACRLACQMIKTHTRCHTIVDPFCGHGTVLVAANESGFHAIGVDRSKKCIKKAQALELVQLL